MSEIWFASDMHFGHKNIIEYCNRPYADVDEMDEALVVNWNSNVRPCDTVYHLGDWAFHNYHHIGRLQGNIVSVPGNHDHERLKKLAPYVSFQGEVVYLKVDPFHRFVLSHYPFESWRREYLYHLHGHMHGTGGVKTNRLDVGIDATKLYRPITLDEVMERIAVSNAWAKEFQK